MPDQLQLRGGTTTEHKNADGTQGFTGVAKEVTVDTTKKTLVVHDGSTLGGTPLMRESGNNAATTVSIGTGGTDAIHIDNNQKIGIGTLSPAGLLHIQNDSASDTKLIIESTATDSYPTYVLKNDARQYSLQIDGENDSLRIFDTTANAERITLNSSGKVGIGTDDPTSLLTLNHATSPFLRLNDSNTTKIGLGADGGESFVFSQDNNPLVFTTSNGTSFSERMRIHPNTSQLQIGGSTLVSSDPYLTLGQSANSQGNVFHLINNGTADLKQAFIAANKTSRHVGIDVSANNFFIGRDSSVTDLTIGYDGKVGIGTTDTSTGQLVVYRQTVNSNNPILQARSDYGTTNSVKFEIDGDGNVGVGTESPNHLIHAKNSSVSTTKIVVESTGTDSYPAFRVTNDARSYDLGIDGGTDAFRIYDVTEPKERFRIDKDGRILFNMSSALDTTAGSLNISGGTAGGRIAMQGTTTSANTNIAEFFAHWNTNKVAGFIARSGTDTTNKDDGELGFFTRASGGDLSERMTIATNGRIRVPIVYSTAGSSMRDVQIESDGNLCGLSSITAAKTNITDLTDVSWIYNLKPKSFNFRKKTVDPVTGVNTYLDEAEDEKAHGFLAEDVETINKDFCFYDKDSEGKDVLAGVYYKTMVVPLIKAVQDLKAENTSLAKRLAALEAK